MADRSRATLLYQCKDARAKGLLPPGAKCNLSNKALMNLLATIEEQFPNKGGAATPITVADILNPDLARIIALYLARDRLPDFVSCFPNYERLQLEYRNPNSPFWDDRITALTGRGGTRLSDQTPQQDEDEPRTWPLRAQHDAIISPVGQLYLPYGNISILHASDRVVMPTIGPLVVATGLRVRGVVDHSALHRPSHKGAEPSYTLNVTALWEDGVLRTLHHKIPQLPANSAAARDAPTIKRIKKLATDPANWIERAVEPLSDIFSRMAVPVPTSRGKTTVLGKPNVKTRRHKERVELQSKVPLKATQDPSRPSPNFVVMAHSVRYSILLDEDGALYTFDSAAEGLIYQLTPPHTHTDSSGRQYTRINDHPTFQHVRPYRHHSDYDVYSLYSSRRPWGLDDMSADPDTRSPISTFLGHGHDGVDYLIVVTEMGIVGTPVALIYPIPPEAVAFAHGQPYQPDDESDSEDEDDDTDDEDLKPHYNNEGRPMSYMLTAILPKVQSIPSEMYRIVGNNKTERIPTTSILMPSSLVLFRSVKSAERAWQGRGVRGAATLRAHEHKHPDLQDDIATLQMGAGPGALDFNSIDSDNNLALLVGVDYTLLSIVPQYYDKGYWHRSDSDEDDPPYGDMLTSNILSVTRTLPDNYLKDVIILQSGGDLLLASRWRDMAPLPIEVDVMLYCIGTTQTGHAAYGNDRSFAIHGIGEW